MHKKDIPSWTAKTLRINEGIILQVGMNIFSILGGNGIIKEIRLPTVMPGTIEDHGTVVVLQDNGECEHYPYTTWQKHLRILS